MSSFVFFCLFLHFRKGIYCSWVLACVSTNEGNYLSRCRVVLTIICRVCETRRALYVSCCRLYLYTTVRIVISRYYGPPHERREHAVPPSMPMIFIWRRASPAVFFLLLYYYYSCNPTRTQPLFFFLFTQRSFHGSLS